MNSKSITPPSLFAQNSSVPEPDPDTEIWEPPFERWMRLADDLLQQWPTSTSPPPECKLY